MNPTLARIIAIVASHSGAPESKPSAISAIDQDVTISGDDIFVLTKALATAFGDHVRRWLCQRFANLSEPELLTGFFFMWRLLTRPIRGRLFEASRCERLELGHIAAVIDRGAWFETEDMQA